MSNRGVSISSLLSTSTNVNNQTNSNNDNSNSDVEATNSNIGKKSIKSLVSMFQPNIKLGGPTAPIVILDDDDEIVSELPSTSLITPNVSINSFSPKLSTILSPKISKPREPLSDHIKKFQTEFKFDLPVNKASINSIVNVDSSPSIVHDQTIASSPVLDTPKTISEIPGDNNSPKKKPLKRKIDPKKPLANKKAKTPMADEIVTKPEEIINIPRPELIEITTPVDNIPHEKQAANQNSEEVEKIEQPLVNETPKELELGKKEEEKKLPIIALNIPLIDPKNPKSGKSQVVVNVLKLAEDKYGWSAIHPNAKSAFEVLGESSDDELGDDDDEDDDEDKDKEKGKGSEAGKEKKQKEKERDEKKKKEELTEEQLMRQHQIKMNRKVGKYDYLDPFIDDNELELEEGISTTKEGFFVFWGPIVDDRNAKKTTKTKR